MTVFFVSSVAASWELIGFLFGKVQDYVGGMFIVVGLCLLIPC